MQTKEALYSTARMARSVLNMSGEPLMEGDFVGVKYRCHAYNAMLRRSQAVYHVTKNNEYWGDVYEYALKDFVI